MPDQVFKLFLCPTCNKYTIHMPRLSQDGRWFVDHKMISEQLFYDDVFIIVPFNYCEVTVNDLAQNREAYTRTVIRV